MAAPSSSWADDGLKHLIREKCDRRTNVRKAPMGRHEIETVASAIAKHTEHTNAHPVLEILFPQILRHWPLIHAPREC